MDVLCLVALLFVGAIARPENGWQSQQGPGPVGGGPGPVGGGSGPMRGGSGPMGGGKGPMQGGTRPMGGGSRPMGGGSGPMGGGPGPMGGGSGPMRGGSGPMGGGSGPMGGGSGPMGGGPGPMGRRPWPMREGPGPKGGRYRPKNESSELMRERHRPKNESSELMRERHRPKNNGSGRLDGRGSQPPVVPGLMKADLDQSKGPFDNGNSQGVPDSKDVEPDFPGWPRSDFGSVGPLDYAAHRGGPHGGGPHGGGPHGGRRPSNPNTQFIPIFKADNITLQGLNVTLPLKEGENIFILPTIRGLPQMDMNAPQEFAYGGGMFGAQPYMRVVYNPRATQKISFEYGVMQLLPSFLKAESGSNEDTPV
ncbi:translation initiation factor IF-2 [Pangasianodon hypophthalmus]|uniref:translation initiation factor IF-2 n=1 Tax=Pangasianodon hypophthalmus TaxID=310915 RepID=UPI0023071CA0|nr:translation initiation factor IF-2 [Pangasianodon hypophthalmus]XP_053086983.1 translation initiation factor IF-2 [Pangasianodon hypophthalmus]